MGGGRPRRDERGDQAPERLSTKLLAFKIKKVRCKAPCYSTVAGTAATSGTGAAAATSSCSAFNKSASTFLFFACLLPIEIEFASASLNTLVIERMYPPCAIPAISGWVRPGRTWYFRSQGSTMEGARSSGMDLRRAWQS